MGGARFGSSPPRPRRPSRERHVSAWLWACAAFAGLVIGCLWLLDGEVAKGTACVGLAIGCLANARISEMEATR